MENLFNLKIKILFQSKFDCIKSNSNHCHICEKEFDENSKIVIDHNHYTGAGVVRGKSHNQCNLNYKKSFAVPVVFHNLSGYDSHFIIKCLAKANPVSVLPVNKEKYISFTQYQTKNDVKFRFIDSYRFLGASLDELVTTLDSKNFKNLNREFNQLSKEQLKLLMRKGVFCYDFVDSWEKLENSYLPPIEQFYNKLNDCNISDDEYKHAKLIWDRFDIKNLGQYSDLYLKTDVMLLFDVFENFRIRLMKLMD